MVGILLDQNATRAEGVFVPFFGVAASTSKDWPSSPCGPTLRWCRRSCGGRRMGGIAST
jgi:hypothetical protein